MAILQIAEFNSHETANGAADHGVWTTQFLLLVPAMCLVPAKARAEFKAIIATSKAAMRVSFSMKSSPILEFRASVLLIPGSSSVPTD